MFKATVPLDFLDHCTGPYRGIAQIILYSIAVQLSELGPDPLPQEASVSPPVGPGGGGVTHSRAGEGVGADPIQMTGQKL